jgi:crotonobetainyl-CoA:carnitine CoA-transferase CaiB-like acyl-CoA transferase
MTELPLAGVRVLDGGQVVAGPFIGQLLADFGAEVIKVEQPGRGDPYRFYGPRKNGVPLGWKVLARNKKSVTLHLGQPSGQALFRQLAGHSDVVIQSFRPPTLERYGLTYERLAEVNPRVVVVLVSGFGQTGPYRDRPGFGTLVEAMSGYAELTGQPDGPPTLPQFALADSVAALYGAFGVMNALYWRDAAGGGVGQCIDLSLLEPLFSILGPLSTLYDQLGVVMQRTGSRIYANAPRNVYATRDDRWIAIAASTEPIARRCFEAIGRPELSEDPRFATAQARVEHVDEVDRIMSEWISQRTLAEAMEVFERHVVSAAPVMGIADLFADPHVKARGMIRAVEDSDLGTVRMQGVLPALSLTPGSIRQTGPSLGEHNDEIYGGLLGLSDSEREQLGAQGVI